MNRILIAEDEARLASFLEKGLRSNGFVTTTASDGPTALALARDDDFDLLILDLGLPGLDGMTILRTLRAQGQRLPVLILSARDEVADKVAGLEHGADDYVAKPIGWVSTLSSASGCRWMELTRFRGHPIAWACRPGQRGCPDAENASAVCAGVPS
jgi:CheY-like chemotaxis protein